MQNSSTSFCLVFQLGEENEISAIVPVQCCHRLFFFNLPNVLTLHSSLSLVIGNNGRRVLVGRLKKKNPNDGIAAPVQIILRNLREQSKKSAIRHCRTSADGTSVLERTVYTILILTGESCFQRSILIKNALDLRFKLLVY